MAKANAIAKDNANVNARANVKNNANMNARANAKDNANVNARANYKDNANVNARANVKDNDKEEERGEVGDSWNVDGNLCEQYGLAPQAVSEQTYIIIRCRAVVDSKPAYFICAIKQ